MQYLRARYYNPASGTFNRLDPFAGNMQDPQSLHKYLYVHGDPIQGIDPLGLYEGLSGLIGTINIIAFNAAQLLVAAGPAIKTVTIYAGYFAIGSFVAIVFEELGFIPDTPIPEIAFSLSLMVFSAGMTLSSLSDSLRGTIGPLRNGRGQVYTGREANRRHAQEVPANSPPYYKHKPAAEGKVAANADMVRVYRQTGDPATDTSQAGRWCVPRSEIRGLSPAQIQAKMALPFEPTHVTDVNAAGISARTGTVGPNFDESGGGIQVELLEFGQFSNPKPIPAGGI